jgi:hypothetical protein
MSETEVTVTVNRLDLEAFLDDMAARRLPDMTTADGTDRVLLALRETYIGG